MAQKGCKRRVVLRPPHQPDPHLCPHERDACRDARWTLSRLKLFGHLRRARGLDSDDPEAPRALQHGEPEVAPWALNGWETGEEELPEANYQEQLLAIEQGIRDYVEQERDKRRVALRARRTERRRDQLDRVACIVPSVVEDEEDNYYPILIAWNSGLVSNYFGNLFAGAGPNVIRILGSPYNVARDLVEGALEAPVYTVNTLEDWVSRRIHGGATPNEQTAASNAQALLDRGAPRP